MFAYCRNEPVYRKDISGTEDVKAEDLDGNPSHDEEDIIGGGGSGGSGDGVQVGTPGGGTGDGVQVGTPGGGGIGPGTQTYGFKSNYELNEHYGRHNRSFGYVFFSPQAYLDGANYVIQNGEYVSKQNAYVKFYGMCGHANYAFVGMNREQTNITTFHIKPVSQICFDEI